MTDLKGQQIAEAQILGFYCAYLQVKRIIEKVVHLEAKPSIKILLADCQHSTVAIFGRPCADDLKHIPFIFSIYGKGDCSLLAPFFHSSLCSV